MCGSRVAINVHVFLNGGGEPSHVAINMHSNYYMLEGALTCGSHVAINMHGNYYYMVEGIPHVWQLTCMVITTI